MKRGGAEKQPRISHFKWNPKTGKTSTAYGFRPNASRHSVGMYLSAKTQKNLHGGTLV